jgi:ribosomal protein L1
VDKGKNIHAQIGKMSFTDDEILINFRELMIALA